MARSPCSFLVFIVTVGSHYDVRGVFFFGGARKSEKKIERLSTGLGYDSDNKIEVFLQFFQGEGS